MNQVRAQESAAPRAPARPRRDDERPALFHVTHWKAGSSWVAKILGRCAPKHVVKPKRGVAHFREDPIQPGMVYPRCYVTREQFDRVELPERWARFVVIRDLRDTLVSAYFSVKLSHNPGAPRLDEDRERLARIGREEGLMYMVDQRMVTLSAAIQESWSNAGEPLIRYEEMLQNDMRVMRQVFVESGYPMPRRGLQWAVEGARFEQITGGRKRGEEDAAAHERKGIAGDWRNYFNDPLTRAFKERYGELLIATGYERDLDW